MSRVIIPNAPRPSGKSVVIPGATTPARRIFVVGGPATLVRPEVDLVVPQMLATPLEVILTGALMEASGLAQPTMEQARGVLRVLQA